MASPLTKPDRTEDFLGRLNRLSLTRSFTPQFDIDWGAQTTEEEYESLYPAWGLLVGTGLDHGLDFAGRVKFVKYQQMNLMLITGLLERHAIGALARLYDLDARDDFAEYVGHFIKEEIYHHMMFQRAARLVLATMPGAPALPMGLVDGTLRWLFRVLGIIPSRRLRTSLTFTIFQFAERLTIQAHQMVQARIGRRDSLVNQVWAFHALDEARHVAFDTLILERSRLPWPLTPLPRWLAAPCCVWLSLLLNANEVWAARQLGLPVHLRQLPGLMRRTQAPFKRQVFALLGQAVRGRQPAERGPA
jgi:hypothetical protein